MASNLIFFSWNRSIPGREGTSAAHFQEFVEYLGGLQQQGTIESFEPVFLHAHGGTMNGFFLIRGETAKLDGLVADTTWQTHIIRATLHLDRPAVVRGVRGEALMAQMALWTETIPG